MFKCLFPGCTHAAEKIGMMDDHHIVPKSMPGTTDKPYNMLLVCPTCHRKIFVPGMKRGHHSVMRSDSIVILGKIDSSEGPVLRFMRCSDGVERFMGLRSGRMFVNEEKLQTDLFDESTRRDFTPELVRRRFGP